MTKMKLLSFRILLFSVMCGSAYAGLRIPLMLFYYLPDRIGNLLTFFCLCVLGSLAYLLFSRIKPKSQDVWNLEFPFFSRQVFSLIIWMFLLMFLIIAIYMSLGALFSLFH